MYIVHVCIYDSNNNNMEYRDIMGYNVCTSCIYIYIYMYRPFNIPYICIYRPYICMHYTTVCIYNSNNQKGIYIFGIQWDSKCIGENRRPPIPVEDISHFPRITQVITCYNYF